MKKTLTFIILLMSVITSCNQPQQESVSKTTTDWKQKFDNTLPFLGHRNWIIIADKAFPQQNAAGMEVINTNENLLPVLKYVLQQVDSSSHVKPIIYCDKELQYITEEQSKGVKQFVNDSKQLFGTQSVRTILHDSVFTKLDEASKLFKVLVLKTNEIIPYTSVFLQLDCAYWNGEKEKQLRESMK